jgi:putative ABC transport system permease protein
MMRFLRLLGQSMRALSRNRGRTFLMMLGTFVGVSALTVLLAIGRGTQREVLQRFDAFFSGSSMFIRPGGGRMRPGAHGAPTTTLTIDDIRAVDSAMPSVTLADPMQATGEREVTYGGRTSRIRIEGHSEAAEVVWNRSVTRGAYFTAADVASAARVALVGEAVARDLFQGRDPIGEQIRIGTVPFQVIGVLALFGIDPHGLDKDNEIIVPISTLMRRVRNVDYIMGAKLLLTAGTDLDAATVTAGEILRRRHGIGPGQEDDFSLHTPVQVQQMVRSSNRVFTLFLPLIAGLAILVGGIVVANLMFMTVHDRRAEIGLRKAVGARERDIRVQFLAEAAAVTGLAGGLALAAGVGVLGVLGHLTGTPARMQWETALLGLGIAVVVGIVAGVAPARRAAALDPIETLR